ncbi:MAG: hypothetical protein K2H09_05210 [Treponemataceae bacterium]|nr:hypothetical protein [Treponemataceae bacterium]
MTNREKFCADARRIIKHARAERNGALDTESVCAEISALFVRESGVPGGLPRFTADYWKKAYIDASEQPADEPSAQNIEILSAMLAFLEGSDECEELLSGNDWHELGQLVSDEAEDLPIDVLQRLMGIIVSKGAL